LSRFTTGRSKSLIW